MSKVIVKENSLTNLADAIREKTGKEDKLTLEQMVEEIGSLGGGNGVFELYDTPVDNIYTLTSEVAESTTNATLETYTLTPLTGSDFSFLENIGLTVATIEYLGEDVEGVCSFKRGIGIRYNVRLHGFAISSPVNSHWISLYNNHSSGNNVTQVNFSFNGLTAGCNRSTDTWNFSYVYHTSYKALPGDYRFTIRRYKIPVSFFGGNAE